MDVFTEESVATVKMMKNKLPLLRAILTNGIADRNVKNTIDNAISILEKECLYYLNNHNF